MSDDRQPAVMREAFHCPAAGCGVFAKQVWGATHAVFDGRLTLLQDYSIARCDACNSISLWRLDEMIHPRQRHGEEPHPEMPPSIRRIYDEARDVSTVSRKSAAGLLRLTLQMLVDELETGKGSIDEKIGRLVGRGLDPQVQQAMDVLRVIGNESVHPGQIDLDADDALLPALFNLTNIIVEQVVARPKHIGGLFAKLPEEKLAGIEARNLRHTEP